MDKGISMGSISENHIGRILFVDQDFSTRKMMESILTRDHFLVVTMPSAEEGLELIKMDDPFDFVISGYILPGMNGLCFLCQVAKLNQKAVRILMSGGFVDTDEVSQALREGSISRYVSKPCCLDSLREDLKNDIAASRAITII
jgi:DNA-binding NtrC family response regulator